MLNKCSQKECYLRFPKDANQAIPFSLKPEPLSYLYPNLQTTVLRRKMLAARGCPESSHLGLRALAPSLKSVLKPEAPLPSHSLDVLASKAEPVPKLPFPGAGSQPELEENLSRITAKEPACKEGTLHPLRVQASVAAPAASPPSSPGSPKRSCPPLPP